MKTIIVKSQAEIDGLPNSFEKYTVVEIRSPGLVIVKKAWGNSSVEAWENSSVMAKGNSSVVARGNSSVEAWENSSVEAWENSSVVAKGNSSVVARGNSSIEAWENSSVEAWENSSVMAKGNSSVVARGNSSIEAWENSLSHIWSPNVKISSAKDQAILIFENGLKPLKIPRQGKKIQVVKRPPLPTIEHTMKTFKECFPKNVDGDHMFLYKSVDPRTGCDFQTGKIKYEGIVECPDFDPDQKRECGGGLHLSPTKGQALSYNLGKILKCRVKLEDIVVYAGNITKIRCRRVEVIGPA